MHDMLGDEEEAPHVIHEESTQTTTENPRKRKKISVLRRGERGVNRWPENTIRVIDISSKGEPLAPIESSAKFRNAIGFLVRDNLDITISKWKDVHDDMKKKLWDLMESRFVLPRGSEKLVKQYAMRQFAISFRNWRSELNTKFLKKGLDTTTKYKILEARWEVFKAQKSDPDFVARSEANSELAKRNKYHHHLGIGGYKHQLPKQREEESAKKASGIPVLSEQISERSANWLRARKAKETETGLTFLDPMIEEASKNILVVAAKEKEGSFK